jgi:transposase-like protein
VAIVVAKNDSNLTCHLLQTDNHDEADHLCEQILNAFHCIEREANAKYLEEKEHRQNELEQKRRIRKTAQ